MKKLKIEFQKTTSTVLSLCQIYGYAYKDYAPTITAANVGAVFGTINPLSNSIQSSPWVWFTGKVLGQQATTLTDTNNTCLISTTTTTVKDQIMWVDLGTRMVVREVKVGSMNLKNKVWLVDPMSPIQTYSMTSTPTIATAFGTSTS